MYLYVSWLKLFDSSAVVKLYLDFIFRKICLSSWSSDEKILVYLWRARKFPCKFCYCSHKVHGNFHWCTLQYVSLQGTVKLPCTLSYLFLQGSLKFPCTLPNPFLQGTWKFPLYVVKGTWKFPCTLPYVSLNKKLTEDTWISDKFGNRF